MNGILLFTTILTRQFAARTLIDGKIGSKTAERRTITWNDGCQLVELKLRTEIIWHGLSKGVTSIIFRRFRYLFGSECRPGFADLKYQVKSPWKRNVKRLGGK